MRRSVAAIAAAAALGTLAAAAAASIVLRVSPRELADTAHLVVEGRVSAVDVRWDDDRTCINTYVTFAVERTHKGPAAASIVIKVPGGRVGDEEVRVEGTARFSPGEEAMAFLWKDGRGEWIVLGEAQGKFLLRHDTKTSRRMAENSLRGLCLVVRGDPKDPGHAAARRPDSLPYDDLVAVVRASVEASRRGAPATTGTRAGDGAPATRGGEGTETEGRDPAPPKATPDPPSTNTPGGGAPPPTKDAPVPPTGKPVPTGEPKASSEDRR